MLALLYDIHGNLPALEAVLDEAQEEGVDGYLLGGDFAAYSPWALETVERLRALPASTWIRGNGERWLREPPTDRPEVMEALGAAGVRARYRGGLALLAPDRGRARRRPVRARLADLGRGELRARARARRGANARRRSRPDGRVRAQPPTVPPAGAERHRAAQPGQRRYAAGRRRTAAWAVRRDDGSFELRRTDYDVERAIAGFRTVPGPFGAMVVQRLERGRD